MNINSKVFLHDQYKDSSNLDIRIRIHDLFSTNKKDWHHWVFDQIQFSEKCQIIEFGCGNGALWKKNKDKILKDWEIVLTDLSEGMLQDVKHNIGELNYINYKVMDIQSIVYEDSRFDIVVANHMLYHVPNRNNAFSEIRRILKPNGSFYAATNGQNHMKEIYSLVEEFNSSLPFHNPMITKEFGLENGEEQLRDYFMDVQKINFESDLKITNVHLLADYIFSVGTNLKEVINDKKYNEFSEFLESKKAKDGYVHISKETGVFICCN